MIGPLPPLYRFLVCVSALLACVGIGAWLTFALPVEMLPSAGAAVGTALGLLVVLALLRETGTPDSAGSHGSHGADRMH